VHGEPALRRSQLTGTWRLSSATTASADGSVSHPLGHTPSGLLTYTADGWMSAVILPGKESGAPPICYAGRTEPAKGSIVHVIEVGIAPFSAGTIQSRHARLDPAGHLILVAPAGVADTRATTFRWTRASAGDHPWQGPAARHGRQPQRSAQ
jgi:hypothetical protein